MSEFDQQALQTEAIRALADGSNTFCVFATIYEITALLRPEAQIPSPEEALLEYKQLFGSEKIGTVSPADFFSVLQVYADKLTIKISKIMMNPDLIDKFNVPENLKDKVVAVEESQIVEYPNMRVLLRKRKDANKWKTHAETDDGTEKTAVRIDTMLAKGWETGIVVNFERR